MLFSRLLLIQDRTAAEPLPLDRAGWALSKHTTAGSGKRQGNDKGAGGGLKTLGMVDTLVGGGHETQEDDIMAEPASRKRRRQGKATPSVNTRQLYLWEIVSWSNPIM